FSKLEIFPSSCPQVFAPLRADKIMVTGDGKVEKVTRKGYETINGKRIYKPYQAVSCASYLNWACFSDKPFDAAAFEKHLREAVEWVETRLQNLNYTEFSDRLTNDFGELQRTVACAARVVWSNNGYQGDPGLSETKLKASVAAWATRGFFLNDPATWHRAPHG